MLIDLSISPSLKLSSLSYDELLREELFREYYVLGPSYCVKVKNGL